VSSGLAAAGAALRAAQERPRDYKIVDNQLIITDHLLADKILRMIEAGESMPNEIELSFEDSIKLAKFTLTILTHLKREHPLVADHPKLISPL